MTQVAASPISLARRVVAWGATCLLGLAIVGVTVASLSAPTAVGVGSLAQRLPEKPEGWRVERRNVGATESVQSATAEILQYDEAEVRIYSRANLQIEVYVARWSPGKASINVAAGHLPDKCWTLAGWKKLEAGTRQLGADGWAWRRFQAPTGALETIFAHSAGGLGVPYTPEGRIGYPTLVGRLFGSPLALRGEQYFVRFSSATPVSEWWAQPGFPALYAEIARLLHAPGEAPQSS